MEYGVYNEIALNLPQKEAVLTFDIPILVLAGAGSGKTRVITAKIAEIIKSGRAEPFQILAVTFTNKASNEMLERVKKICQIDTSYLSIGTFHSICVKMLRNYAHLIGFKNNFLIADTSDQKKIIKDILAKLGMDAKVFPPSMMLSFISRIKEKFLEPDEFLVNSSKLASYLSVTVFFLIGLKSVSKTLVLYVNGLFFHEINPKSLNPAKTFSPFCIS